MPDTTTTHFRKIKLLLHEILHEKIIQKSIWATLKHQYITLHDIFN